MRKLVRGAATLALGVFLTTGCDGTPPPELTENTDGTCTPLEYPAEQQGQHLIGDREPPVPYSSTPPTSGWHASGHVDIRIYGATDPLTEPEQVSVLEAGGVVVTYNDLDDDSRQRLEGLIRDQFAERAAVTPYDKLQRGEVALTAWGVLQRCEALDLHAVAAFITSQAAETPDFH